MTTHAPTAIKEPVHPDDIYRPVRIWRPLPNGKRDVSWMATFIDGEEWAVPAGIFKRKADAAALSHDLNVLDFGDDYAERIRR